jgi:hypothetical protein
MARRVWHHVWQFSVARRRRSARNFQLGKMIERLRLAFFPETGCRTSHKNKIGISCDTCWLYLAIRRPTRSDLVNRRYFGLTNFTTYLSLTSLNKSMRLETTQKGTCRSLEVWKRRIVALVPAQDSSRPVICLFYA